MKIERDKVYLTRGGDKVRVVCVDGNGRFPVIGQWEDGNVGTWPASGTEDSGSSLFYADLVSEYVEPPKPKEVWVYMDGDRFGGVYADCCFATKPPSKFVKFREVLGDE